MMTDVMSKINDPFEFYEKEYALITKSYEFDEDVCDNVGIFCMDANTIIAPLADIIAFARECCCKTAQEYSLAVLWNDRFVLHYVFGEYMLFQVYSANINLRGKLMSELTIKSYVKIKPYEELVELTEWVGLYRGYADNIYVEKKMLRSIAAKEVVVRYNYSNCLEVFDPNDKYHEVITIPKSFVESYITRGEV